MKNNPPPPPPKRKKNQKKNKQTNKQINKNWAANLEGLLNNLAFPYLLNNQSITQLQFYMVIQKVYAIFLQEWYAELNSSSDLDTYKLLNKTFHTEKYISCIPNESHRLALSRFV